MSALIADALSAKSMRGLAESVAGSIARGAIMTAASIERFSQSPDLGRDLLFGFVGHFLTVMRFVPVMHL